MISRKLRDETQQEQERSADRSRGYGEAGMRMSSHRTLTALVDNVGNLGTVVSDAILQDTSGNFWNLPGYSHPLAAEPFGPNLGLPFSDPE